MDKTSETSGGADPSATDSGAEGLRGVSTGAPDRRKLLRSFARLFAPVALLVVCGAALLHALGSREIERQFLEPERVALGHVATAIDGSLTDVLDLLRSLVQHEAAIQQEIDRRALRTTTISREFATVLSRHPGIEQIRWIGEDGRERVRLNRQPGEPPYAVVPQSELQDKSERYYVQAGLRLARGEFYLSPMDLNVERGEVDRPERPTLRMVAPVFTTGGEARGLFVVNVSGHNLLQRIARMARSASEFHLLTSSGEALVSAQGERGVRFSPGSQERFSVRFPVAWAGIATGASGQACIDGACWAWTRVRPVENAAVQWPDGYWVGITRANERELTLAKQRQALWIAAATLAVLAVLALATWKLTISDSRAQRLMDERERLASEAKALQQELVRMNDTGRLWNGAPVGAALYGVPSARQSSPGLVEEIEQHYGRVLEQSLESRVLKKDFKISDQLGEIASDLAFVHAGPRDVLELHGRAVAKAMERESNALRAKAFAEESRWVLLELMGRLVQDYRKYLPGRSGPRRAAHLPPEAARARRTHD